MAIDLHAHILPFHCARPSGGLFSYLIKHNEMILPTSTTLLAAGASKWVVIIYINDKLWYDDLMKKDIHPKYYEKAKVTCACGNTFEVGSTVPELKVEVCSACHPFYTGTAKFIDTAGRVDKFRERVRKAEEMSAKGRSASGGKAKKGKKNERGSKKAAS